MIKKIIRRILGIDRRGIENLKLFIGMGGRFSFIEWSLLLDEEKEMVYQISEDVQIFTLLYPVYVSEKDEKKRIELARILDDRGFSMMLDQHYEKSYRKLRETIDGK